MVCCFVPAQKLFSKSLATPDISGPRSASSACSTPGTRNSRFIPMSTVSSRPVGSPSITPAGSDPVLTSFSPSKYSDVCFAVSLSPLSSRPLSMANCTFPAIWLCSGKPRSSLPGSGHCSEKTGSFTPNHPSAAPEYVLQYLGRYTHRVAISNHRLVSLANGQVTFRWRDSAHHNEQKLMTVSLDEFLRRF